jgi:diguanylate cyclase (GGDEF)-like protein
MSLSPGKFIRSCLLAFCLLAAPDGQCAPVGVDVRCDGTDLFAPASRGDVQWRHIDDGRLVLTPAQAQCWMRISTPLPGNTQFAFRTNWVDVALFDAHGTLLGETRHMGRDANSVNSTDHIIMPTAPSSTPLYARLSLVPGWRMPAEVALEAVEMASLLEHDRRVDNINLATVVVLVTIGVVLLIFAAVLRYPNYLLLAAFLLMSAWVRLLQTGQLFAFVDDAWWIWPAWASMWPLVNALMALTAARIGRFAHHAPRVHLACVGTACLFLPLCLLWPVHPSLSDELNAVLHVPLYGLLIAGSWRGMRRADPACAILFIGSVLGAVAWFPGMVARFVEVSWFSYVDLPVGGLLDVATELTMPLLFCAALAWRQLRLQRSTLRLQRAAVEQASRDALTGLLNRDSLLRRCDALTDCGRAHALVMLNVDRFKAISETLGAPIADQLLQVVGARLAAIDGAIAGRLHADQFCLLWPDDSSIDILRARLERDFAEPVVVNGQLVDLPLSVGRAHASVSSERASVLLRNAGIALDAARVRRVPWLDYGAALEVGRRADLGLLSELSRAIAEGELRMFLQPKVRLSDGAMISAEALVRWQHPLRGLIAPADFVPFAVKTGRIAKLTDWMLEQAMALSAQLRGRREPLQISVNVSARDLVRGGMAAHMASMAARHGALHGDIRLEVTESEAMDDPMAALEAMRELSGAGFTLSIDDFGTGYSSLVYLQKMPVAELKIDRAFVRGVSMSSDAAILLQSTIELGHRLGLSVVAEGPETADEWAMLAAMGCDFAQGWHAAPAMELAEFAQWRALHIPFIGVPVPIPA